MIERPDAAVTPEPFPESNVEKLRNAVAKANGKLHRQAHVTCWDLEQVLRWIDTRNGVRGTCPDKAFYRRLCAALEGILTDPAELRELVWDCYEEIARLEEINAKSKKAPVM